MAVAKDNPTYESYINWEENLLRILVKSALDFEKTSISNKKELDFKSEGWKQCMLYLENVPVPFFGKKLNEYDLKVPQMLSSSEVIFINTKNIGDCATKSSNLIESERKIVESFNDIIDDPALVSQGNGIVNKVKHETKKKEIFNKIVDILLCIYKDYSTKKPPAIEIRKSDWDNCHFRNDRLVMKPIGCAQMTKVLYNRKPSRLKFNLIIYVLGKIANFFFTNVASTKREIYYRIINKITSQDVLLNVINDVSCLLDEPLWDLGIFSTKKGLVYGDIDIFLDNNEVIYCNKCSEGALIPQDVNSINKIRSSAFFILVVEKDTVFQKLSREDVPNKFARPFVMITGKGIADITTRLFLKRLWIIMSVPVFVLTDANPYGIEIMLVYKYGSLNSAHMNEHLALPQLKWIGIHPSEVLKLNLPSQPLTSTDVSKVNDILKRPYINSLPRLKKELNSILELNRKAEIEGLFKSKRFFQDIYLFYKFCPKDYF